MGRLTHILINKAFKEVRMSTLYIVCIYVDDVICMWSSKVMMVEFNQNMMKMFEMSDLGLMSYFLGLEVKQD